MIKKNICFLISVVLLVSAAACHNTNSFESSKASEIITSPSISETYNLSDTDSQTGLSADPDMETALSADDATIDNSEYSSTDSDSDDAVSTDSADVASDVEGSLSNEQVSETDAAAWIKAKLPAYTLRYGEGEKLHLNKDGELIIDDGYYWDTLTDVFTGEITYYTCLRYEITYVNTEGYDNDIIGYNRLYDTDGELVRDWENCDYGYACGDLVIKRPFSPWLSNDTSFDSILLDPIEDELILNDVYYIGKVNNNRALCLNDSDEPICMLDRTGQIAVSLPDNYKIREAEVSNGIIIAEIAYGDDDWHDAILNEDFEVLLEAPENAYYTNLYEYGYIELSTNGINTKFYDSSDYHLVLLTSHIFRTKYSPAVLNSHHTSRNMSNSSRVRPLFLYASIIRFASYSCFCRCSFSTSSERSSTFFWAFFKLASALLSSDSIAEIDFVLPIEIILHFIRTVVFTVICQNGPSL